MRFTKCDQVDANHPCFAGHFPGAPVVPAVLLLARVSAALRDALPGTRITGIPTAKFPAPLGPGVAFDVCLEQRSDARFAFECRAGVALFAHGELTVEPPRSRTASST